MDHVRGAHNVPWIMKMANMEQFVPPWTVRGLVGFVEGGTLGDLNRHFVI